MEKPWENCSDGDFTYEGAGGWGMAQCDVRHILEGTLGHVGHLGARIPKTHNNVLFAKPAISLTGGLVRNWEDLPLNKGIVEQMGHEAAWMGLPSGMLVQG